MAIALRDPVRPEAEIEPTVSQFLQMCREKRWGRFLPNAADFMLMHRRLRARKLKICIRLPTPGLAVAVLILDLALR